MLAGDEPGRSIHTAQAITGNLPRRPTGFVGRVQERVDLDRAVASSRLVTVTGVGGCGKSRLALEVAAGAYARHPDGSWWVELGPLGQREQVESALASALEVRPLPGQSPLGAASSHLADGARS